MTRYVGSVEQSLHAVTSRPHRSSVPVQPAVPEVLARLLQATNERLRDAAWTEFMDKYSRLLLYVARRNTPDYDGAMDAYAFVLERLREHEMHRLRGYAADGRGKFTTWLVVVSRRLCLDFYRHRYGRAPNPGPTVDVDDMRAARRRLVDLALSTGDDSLASQTSDDQTDGNLRREELEHALDVVMKELAAPDRLLLAMRFQDGLSGAEIASLLHFASPFHVYRRVNHLLVGLRERLIALGVRSSAP
jgi:RNA polymerase sigma factor (sigma-70 family)